MVAGVVGFFTVLRGSAFAAHAIPNGSFAGAAGAGLVGVSTLFGLGVFAFIGALGIGLLGRRGRHDAVTALMLVMMLATGALFVSLSTRVRAGGLLAALRRGARDQLQPARADADPRRSSASPRSPLLYRPLMLSSALPEVGEARGIGAFAIELAFLGVLALATAMTVPVVGTLLIFSLMIGAPAAARSLTDRPGVAMALSVVIALAVVWFAIAASYETDWPVGFFVGTGERRRLRRGPALAGRRASATPAAAASRGPRIGGMTTAARQSWEERALERPAGRRLPPRRRPHGGDRGARPSRLRGHRARPRGASCASATPGSAGPASTAPSSSSSSSAWCSGSRSAAAPRASSASTRPATTITTRSAATAAAWSPSRTRAWSAPSSEVAGTMSFDVTEHDVVLRGRAMQCTQPARNWIADNCERSRAAAAGREARLAIIREPRGRSPRFFSR